DQLEKAGFEPIPAAPENAAPIVSAAQRRLFYAWKVDPDSIAYNIPVAIKLRGEVNVEKLTQCLQVLVDRHDACRMRFFMEDEPRLITTTHGRVTLNMVEDDSDDVLRSLVQPFDLLNGPLFRFALLNNSLLFLDFHHIISDGRSVFLFIRELLQLYNGAVLPALPVTFKDVVMWERQTTAAAKQYWTDQFADEIPVLTLPYDFQRPAVPDNRGQRWRFTLPQPAVARLKEICTATGTSAHAFLLTAYQVLLAKYSGREEVVIGIPAHGRIHPDIQSLQGMFVNNLPLLCTMKGEDTFATLMGQNFRRVSQAIDHQELPFNELVQALDLPVNPGRNPLFDTMFLYQDLSEFSEQQYRFDPGFAKFDITLDVIETTDGFSFELEYATSLFTADTVKGMAQGLVHIIQQVVNHPEVTMAALSPVAPDEMTASPGKPYTSIIALFEAQVALNPGQIAMVWGDQEITYGELAARAQMVGHALQRMGIGKSDLVGIHMKRSADLVIAILGVLKAGAAYLPLEYDTPAERIRFILEDSRCGLLINDLNIFGDGRVMPPVANEPDDLAYVIYTSGSTGTPKGVMINHDSLFNYISWAADTYTDSSPCTFALYSSISFDLTVTSIFTPLITGNKMVIYGEDDTDIAIGNVVKHNVANIVKLTPAHLRLLVSNGLLSAATNIKRFIVGGEAFDSALAREVHELTNGQTALFNEYGPTEATVGCMIYQFHTEDSSMTVPIGGPISDTRIYILDKYLMPVPAQVPGEIYIAGRGLARGYLYREELTAERFFVHEAVRLYKTGDVAKKLPDGNMVYLGRNDNQVKISGNRVELSEVEAQLSGFTGMEAAIVLPDKRNPNGLIAYIVTGDTFSEALLPDYLAMVLPYFMIPKRFIQIDAIPLTKNGKVDTARLQAIALTAALPQVRMAESSLEKIFVTVWEEVLHTKDTSITDNFFEHGGDSIKAVQLSSKLFEQGISVKVKDILTYHTIAQISRHAVFATPPADTGVVSGEIMPTPIQSWFFSYQFNRPECYTQSVLLKMNEQPDRHRLEEALAMLVAHHDTLRINYDEEKEVLFYNNEHLHTAVEVPELVINSTQTIAAACNEIRHSFDLAKGLLFKACLLKVPDGTTLLFLTAHHLVVDGISWRILLQDLYNVYTEKSAVLPPRTASYKDWSHVFDVHEFDNESDYWAEMELSHSSVAPGVEISDYSMKNTKTVVVSLDAEMTTFLLTDAHTAYKTDVLILLNAAMVLTLRSRTGASE
ncbi:amino acid adenylation domain-containing protein, partial [Chitinophaga sp.]|uniref:amino acid adenylation domain-containing protein n=1 Tax=Chitinophaga sp. TaxID=1869181 RepID=UPI002F95698B